MFDFMPVQASSWAARVDWINNLITDISVVCTIAITLVMLYFGFRYRRRSETQETAFITHNTLLETVWTVVPTVIVMFIFYYGFVVYKEMREPPTNAMEVMVDAYSWRWEYTYPNGKKATRDLVVPVDRPVRLIMTSHDVIHSFFVPAMRVKEDVYAGNYSYLWFTPTTTGEFHIFCTEYCGVGHSAMLGKLKVVPQEQFDDFLQSREAADAPEVLPLELGKQLYTLKACNTCHSLDGSALVGPSFKGLFAGGERELADGSKVKIDENYVKESILNSTAKVAKGFQPIMPAYAGQLSEKEVQGLIAYLKSL